MIKVIYDSDNPQLKYSPCGCVRSKQLIVINPLLFYAMREFDQRFWLLHEEGHIVLNTNDEVEADAYAFDKLVGTEYRSLKQMVAALENLLVSGISPEVDKRKTALMDRALRWDALHSN